MLCDSQGRPYAESRFPADMNPADMMKELDKAKAAKTKRDTAFAKADKAEGLGKAELLIAALGTVPRATVIGAYGKTIDQIAKLDPEDKTGFVKKALVDRAHFELEGGFADLMEEEKTDDAIKHIEAYLESRN